MAHNGKQFQEQLKVIGIGSFWGYVDDNGDAMKDLCKW